MTFEEVYNSMNKLNQVVSKDNLLPTYQVLFLGLMTGNATAEETLKAMADVIELNK